ncbi:oxaloacetate tautomerase FAHD1, mitochondrial-like [Periplaneta americana]|uniref:oxaloacetate tautomerase FAHD1, mitochondrial-like n=1 Tax=Periplaneta americana TaxID=6978 RepID=UPI0037E78C7C
MAAKEIANFIQFGKKIAGAGLNYKSLLAERNLPLPKVPVIFLKPTSSYIIEGQCIEIPKDFEVHEEVELGVIIGRRCKNVPESEGLKCIGGYCLALDLTEVRLMKEIKAKGLPWTFGKGFDTACPVSRFIHTGEIKDPSDVQIWCKVNGKLRQNENTSDMVFPIPSLISYISKYMTLEPGDLILTGSPSGVGPIVPGDTIEAGMGEDVSMVFPVKTA